MDNDLQKKIDVFGVLPLNETTNVMLMGKG